MLMPYADNKGADQPAHPRNLISAFVVRCLDSIIPLLAISKKLKTLDSFWSRAAQFESHLVGHPKYRFPRDEAQYIIAWLSSCPTPPMYHHTKQIQATPAMSTSHISILPLMSKWFFIPNIFSLCFFAFQLRLCRKRLTWSNRYLEVIFHALDVFSVIFATVYVEVKVGHIVCFGYVHVLAEVLLRLCTCISWGVNVFQTTIKIKMIYLLLILNWPQLTP